eukprot:13735294-Ditylum_brightwellii.AAC.1
MTNCPTQIPHLAKNNQDCHFHHCAHRFNSMTPVRQKLGKYIQEKYRHVKVCTFTQYYSKHRCPPDNVTKYYSQHGQPLDET